MQTLKEIILLLIIFQVSGLVYFSAHLAERLLALHTVPPLDACTYMGLDSGAKPIQVDSL